jgi:hypothetical protein
VEVAKTGFAISGSPKTAAVYYVESALPDKVIADRYLATTYTGNDNDRVKYSYTYDGYDFYYIYLGQMSSIPLYSFEPQTHSLYNFDYTVSMSEEKKNLVQKTVSESSMTAVKTVQENTTSSKNTYGITVELNAKVSGSFVSAEQKNKFEYKREDFVQNTITNSQEYTTSLTDTVMNGTEYATRETFTRTFKWDAGDSSFPQGFYRYTMFGVSDVYLYVIRDPIRNKIVSYEFLENVIPGQYSWDLEYTEKLPFEKKDASGFKFEVEYLDNLPATNQHYNEFVVTNTDEWNRTLDVIRGGGSGTAAEPKEYTVTVAGNVAVTGSTENSFSNVANVAVTLNGTGSLFLRSQGSLLNIGGDQTVCIDSKLLSLQGLKAGENGSLINNNRTIISVSSTGKLELRDGNISGNITITNTGGVHIFNGGTFIMNGGDISGNTSSGKGGGIYVDGGTFNMNGGFIKGNNAERGGGVYAINKSAFTMVGGTISGNTVSGYGGGAEISSNSAFIMAGGTINNNKALMNSGGVEINVNSTFIMNGGTITENTASTRGGGVLLWEGGIFTMNEGTISDNVSVDGGGVYIGRSTFTMTGSSTISGNTANDSGGGVMVSEGTFTMAGGIISKNTAKTFWGGGVLVYVNSSFKKTGGTITGSNDLLAPNKASQDKRGHAVFVYSNSKPRDNTAGPGDNLDSSINGSAGGWN